MLALGSLLAWSASPSLQHPLAWQPELAAIEPWRAFTAAWVHWSPRHLLGNLAGCAVLAGLGVMARLDARHALAWALAWPLTQWGLLLQPELARFGGLSGVLHAGVAVVALALLLERRGRECWIGAAIALGLVLKLWTEQPLSGPPLRQWEGWDIAIAPLSHLTGAVAGTACAVLLWVLWTLWALWALRRRRPVT